MDIESIPRAATVSVSKLEPFALGGTTGPVLCDLDGCLVSENRAFPEAPAFVAACGARLWLVSNRSDMTAETLSLHLDDQGLAIPAERILLAGEFTLVHLAASGLRRLRLCATPALKDAARALGIDPEAQQPEAVLLCRDPTQNVDTLGLLLNDAARGVPLWVSNEDLSHPDHLGGPVAETGALLAALRAIRPTLAWQSLGKPNPAMLRHALDRASPDSAGAIFVGDNAATDGEAAAAVGIPFLHVRRSVTR